MSYIPYIVWEEPDSFIAAYETKPARPNGMNYGMSRLYSIICEQGVCYTHGDQKSTSMTAPCFLYIINKAWQKYRQADSDSYHYNCDTIILVTV